MRFTMFFELRKFATVSLSVLGVTLFSASDVTAQANWAGYYVGGHLGYADGTAEWSIVDSTGSATDRSSSCASDPGCNPEFDLGGALGGIHAGAQWQYGSFVVGAEASFSFTGLEETVLSEVGAEDDEFTTSVDNVATLVARVGYDLPVSQPVLVFATAGYAGGKVETSTLDEVPSNIGLAENDEWQDGWTAGVGVEYQYRSNIIIGAEYKYFDLGSVEHLAEWDTGGINRDDVDVTFQSLALRVSYRF